MSHSTSSTQSDHSTASSPHQTALFSSGDSLQQAPYTSMIVLDAGGSKTDAMWVSNQGKILNYIQGGTGNYQATGLTATHQLYKELIDALLVDATDRASIAVCVGGLSGLDRTQDHQRLEHMLSSITSAPLQLMNDTFLILRAGSAMNIGIAVVCGTGSNCVGINAQGERANIGGLGYEFGDWGGGHDLAVSAMRAAFRGSDGRGKTTLLTQAIKQTYHVKDLLELVDFFIADAPQELDWGLITPLLFECAQQQDEIALELLQQAAEEYALCVIKLAQKLFTKQEEFSLVLGGSVFQKASYPYMKDHMIHLIQKSYPHIKPITLQSPPIVGAVLYGLDHLAISADHASSQALTHQIHHQTFIDHFMQQMHTLNLM